MCTAGAVVNYDGSKPASAVTTCQQIGRCVSSAACLTVACTDPASLAWPFQSGLSGQVEFKGPAQGMTSNVLPFAGLQPFFQTQRLPPRQRPPLRPVARQPLHSTTQQRQPTPARTASAALRSSPAPAPPRCVDFANLSLLAAIHSVDLRAAWELALNTTSSRHPTWVSSHLRVTGFLSILYSSSAGAGHERLCMCQQRLWRPGADCVRDCGKSYSCSDAGGILQDRFMNFQLRYGSESPLWCTD